METYVLTVKGMSCGHCVNAIETNVGNLDGVNLVKANLSEGTVTVKFNHTVTTLDTIRDKIEDQGYEIE